MTDVADRDQNRTEPNRWPRRFGRSDAIPRVGTRARLPEVGDTESERRSGPPEWLIKAKDGLIASAATVWPADAAALRRYGREGQQLSEGSRLRWLAAFWSVAVAVPMSWSHLWRAWAWQRPLRLAALVAVIVLVNLFIPGSTPPWVWAFLIGFLL